jgi:hypothetical protein
LEFCKIGPVCPDQLQGGFEYGLGILDMALKVTGIRQVHEGGFALADTLQDCIF